MSARFAVYVRCSSEPESGGSPRTSALRAICDRRRPELINVTARNALAGAALVVLFAAAAGAVGRLWTRRTRRPAQIAESSLSLRWNPVRAGGGESDNRAAPSGVERR